VAPARNRHPPGPQRGVRHRAQRDGHQGRPVFHPYLRDPETLARPWAVPGTAGLEHRIGGIEKADITGAINYDPDNHERMTHLRQRKVDGIATTIPPLVADDPTGDADLLVLGWGSTYGPISAAARELRSQGRAVATAHVAPPQSPAPQDG
jgi:2-oxoglutarate ferredoxin oxidoreductase subunit alpha